MHRDRNGITVARCILELLTRDLGLVGAVRGGHSAP